MKAFLFVIILFVAITFGVKSCQNGGVGGMSAGSFFTGSKPKAPSTPVPGRKPDTPPAAVAQSTATASANGIEIRKEVFRGWIGGIDQLRTADGQYKAGEMCAWGMCERIQGKSARIRAPSGGLVFVVAVDSYPVAVEPAATPAPKTSLAPDPVVPENAKIVTPVPAPVVASPVAAAPATQEIGLTRLQERQVRAGIPIKVTMPSATAKSFPLAK